MQDLRHGVRTLRKSPTFTVVAIAMLGLGIDINVAVFTVADAALFKGFPLVRENERIVQITTTKGFIYYPDLQDWRTNATSSRQSLSSVASTHAQRWQRSSRDVLHDRGDCQHVWVARRRADARARFSLADEQRGAEPVVILRYKTWMSRFGGNPTVVGNVVRIDGLADQGDRRDAAPIFIPDEPGPVDPSGTYAGSAEAGNRLRTVCVCSNDGWRDG